MQMGSADDSMNVVFTYSEDLHDQKSEGFYTKKSKVSNVRANIHIRN